MTSFICFTDQNSQLKEEHLSRILNGFLQILIFLTAQTFINISMYFTDQSLMKT